jgi:hypothetical protein
MPPREYSRTELDWAWAAGLFEGEGSIVNYIAQREGSSYRRRVLALKMTDEDVVRRFHSIVQAGRVTLRRSKNERHKDQWAWECTRWADIENTLRRFLPYLGERRREAAEFSLAHPAFLPRTHCLKGHEFTPENTYVHPASGSRSCRECRHQAYLRTKVA